MRTPVRVYKFVNQWCWCLESALGYLFHSLLYYKEMRIAVCCNPMLFVSIVTRLVCWLPQHCEMFWGLATWLRSSPRGRPFPTRCRRPWTRQLILGALKSRESRCEEEVIFMHSHFYIILQSDQKVSVHLTITVQNWWFEDGHHRIHSECGPCYTEHGLREHSSTCQ